MPSPLPCLKSSVILTPDPRRVSEIDCALRARLAESFDYLGELGPARTRIDGERIARLAAGFRERPQSPWVFGLYAKLVAELAGQRPDEAARVFSEIEAASAGPASSGILSLDTPVIPSSWWAQFRLLFDTDPRRPFQLTPPAADDLSACTGEIRAGLDLLARADAQMSGETTDLLRMIVLAAPHDPGAERFNGASTFFLWGAVLLNAAVRRDRIAMIDALVHESSHVLLFGIAADQPLTRNAGEERYASPLRNDERPIEGIFHACFVSTRVHLALDRLLASGMLEGPDADVAAARAGASRNAAVTALEVLDRHAIATDLGGDILADLRTYWSGRDGPRD